MKPSVSRNTAAPPLALTLTPSGLNSSPLTSSVCGSAAAAITPMPSAVSTAASATVTPVWTMPSVGCSSEKPIRNSDDAHHEAAGASQSKAHCRIPGKPMAEVYQAQGKLSARAKGRTVAALAFRAACD